MLVGRGLYSAKIHRSLRHSSRDVIISDGFQTPVRKLKRFSFVETKRSVGREKGILEWSFGLRVLLAVRTRCVTRVNLRMSISRCMFGVGETKYAVRFTVEYENGVW